MFVYMINNKKFTQMVTELFIRTRKMHLYFFITKSCFPVPKDVRVNCTRFSFMKLSKKSELQQITLIHSLDFAYRNFMNYRKTCTAKPYFL